MKLTELEYNKIYALNAAKELGYPCSIIKRIILAEKSSQIDQAMVDGRNSDNRESWETIVTKLTNEGIKIPRRRTTIGQNFVD